MSGPGFSNGPWKKLKIYVHTIIHYKKLNQDLFSHDWNAKNPLRCKCLQGFAGFSGFFSAISMEKGSKNHKETLYSSKGMIVYVVGNPYNIYRL